MGEPLICELTYAQIFLTLIDFPLSTHLKESIFFVFPSTLMQHLHLN